MVIGINGKAGSGKSTIASIIQYLIALDGASELIKEELKKQGAHGPYNYGDFSRWYAVGIADAPRVMYHFLYGEMFPVEPGEKKEEMRQDFKNFCNKMRETLGEDVWLNATIRLNSIHYPDSNTIISDIRFENEAKYCKENGLLIRVNSNKEDPNESTELDNYKDFDAIIENNDDIDALQEEVRKMLVKFELISEEVVTK